MKKRRKIAASALMWPITVMIVVMFIGIFMLMFVKQNADVTKTASGRAACRSSVMAHSQFGTEINCPVDIIKIDEKTPETIKKKLSELMVECWDDYGKGKVQLFNADSLGGRGDKFCAFCSIISFKKPVENVDGLNYFLATHYFSRGGKRVNYHEYLTRNPAEPEVVQVYKRLAEYELIDTTQKYAILFTFYKERVWYDYLLAAGPIIYASGVATTAIGNPIIGIGVSSYLLIKHFEEDEALDRQAVESAITEKQVGGEGFKPGLIITLLNISQLKELGCEELPVSISGIEYESKDK